MGPSTRAACRLVAAVALVALAGCNSIFGLDPPRTDATTDGTGDAPSDVAPDAPCAWRSTSNVSACEVGADRVTADWTLVGSGTMLDTSADPSSWNVPGGAIRLGVPATGNRQVAVVAVQNLTIPAASTLLVTGDRPLVILVNGTAMIDGRITFEGAKRSETVDAVDMCPGKGGPGHGAISSTVGSGGGGGSLGSSGGQGGAAGGDAGGPVFAVAVNAAAVPLFMGCDGGRGGLSTKVGRGGGAIEISARTEIAIGSTAAMIVGGAGGAGGILGKQQGGGGGGSGGMILIEAPQVAFTSGAAGPKLCANGGGGGAGGSTAVAGGDGSASSCVNVGALGGTGGAGAGGTGASRSMVASAGGSGAADTIAGGGGGGGFGVIRVNGGTVTGMPFLSTPALTTGP